MNIDTVFSVIYYGIALVFIIISIVSAVINWLKARKVAKTAEEKSALDKQMEAKALELIGEAEVKFKKLNDLLKLQGDTAGPLKHENVINKLQEYATSISANFDLTYWTERVKELVAFTRGVNKE